MDAGHTMCKQQLQMPKYAGEAASNRFSVHGRNWSGKLEIE